MNSVQLIGHLGDDPELNQTNSGRSVCNLSIATNRSYKDGQGNKREETTWHTVVVWGEQAENCARFLSKGRQVAVEGRLQENEWEDRNGNQRKDLEIVARRVHFLSDGNGSSAKQRGQPKQQPSPGNPAAQGRNQSQGRGGNASNGGGGGWPDNNAPRGGGGGETWPDEGGTFGDDDVPF